MDLHTAATLIVILTIVGSWAIICCAGITWAHYKYLRTSQMMLVSLQRRVGNLAERIWCLHKNHGCHDTRCHTGGGDTIEMTAISSSAYPAAYTADYTAAPARDIDDEDLFYGRDELR